MYDTLSNSLDIWEGVFGTLLVAEYGLSTRLDHQPGFVVGVGVDYCGGGGNIVIALTNIADGI